MISFILGLFKVLGVDILPKVLDAYNKKADTLVKNNETTADVAKAMIQADIELNKHKAENLNHKDWVTQGMVFMLGWPVALHWTAICLDSTFRFGWGVPAIPGLYGEAEIEIIKSFFLIGVGATALTTVAKIIKR